MTAVEKFHISVKSQENRYLFGEINFSKLISTWLREIKFTNVISFLSAAFKLLFNRIHDRNGGCHE